MLQKLNQFSPFNNHKGYFLISHVDFDQTSSISKDKLKSVYG